MSPVLYILTLLFFGAVFIQIIYLITFLIAFSKKMPANQITGIPVSVIVCAHDEEENIKELVPLLLQQDYAEFEVIIVEDRSNDGTFDYLLEATKANARLKMVRVESKPEHINGKKFALTLGIKAAKHDWVLLTDADCRPSSTQWITEMSKNFLSEAQIVLGYSPYLKRKGLLNSFIRYEGLLTGIQYIGLALLGKPYMGVGRNLAYRKSLFLQNKGFNSHLSITGGDDDLFVNEFATSQNTQISLGPDSVVYSEPKHSWGEYFHQKLRHLSVGKYYSLGDKIIVGLFSVSLLLCWILVVPAAFYFPLMYYVGGAFLLRWSVLISLAHTSSRRMGDQFEAWKTPFLDFIFAFYYLVTGVIALQTKKIRWKRT